MTVPSKTYYVSSLHGSADFDGLTPQTPFLHPAQVSALSLQPGDKVLLERGSVFAGEALHLKNCGDIAGAPIEIGAYGTGDALPCIAANGTGVWYQDYGTPLDFDGHVYRGEVSSAVLLYDVENIVLRDLEITNDAPFTDLESYCAADKMDRTGVAVVARDRGTLHSITLTGLFVHDVKGNVYNKHMNNGGIYMTALTPADEAKTGVARYDGVTVENCMVQQVSRWGIAVGYSGKSAPAGNADKNQVTANRSALPPGLRWRAISSSSNCRSASSPPSASTPPCHSSRCASCWTKFSPASPPRETRLVSSFHAIRCSRVCSSARLLSPVSSIMRVKTGMAWVRTVRKPLSASPRAPERP